MNRSKYFSATCNEKKPMRAIYRDRKMIHEYLPD